MAKWRTVNHQMMNDRQLRDRWRRYAGINQRALGSMLERQCGDFGHLLQLPCAEWNCEDSAWASFDPNVTRIIHVKSALRAAIEVQGGFGPKVRQLTPTSKPHLRRLAERWMEIATAAEKAGAHA
jgi:hypothetical protein